MGNFIVFGAIACCLIVCGFFFNTSIFFRSGRLKKFFIGGGIFFLLLPIGILMLVYINEKLVEQRTREGYFERKYVGVLENGSLVTLTFKKNMTFQFESDSCSNNVKGNWDLYLSDYEIIELYPEKYDHTIQAISYGIDALTISNSTNQLTCSKREILKLSWVKEQNELSSSDSIVAKND